MKYLLTLLLLSGAPALWAQDYCKQVKKEVTENNTSFSFESPYNEDDLPAARVVRNYSTNTESEFDNFNVIFTIPCEYSTLIGSNNTEIEESKVIIEFDDKTQFKDDAMPVTHERKEGTTMAYRVAVVTLLAENIKDFTSKKVAKIKLATADRTLTAAEATALQQYIICVNNAKKLQ